MALELHSAGVLESLCRVTTSQPEARSGLLNHGAALSGGAGSANLLEQGRPSS
jgi:hypothetical protein